MPNRVLKLSAVKKNPITFLALGNSLTYQDRNGTGSLTASGALRYQPGSGGRINLCPDPSFEDASLARWTKFTSGAAVVTLSQDTTTSYVGVKCLKADCVNIDTSGNALVWQGGILAHQCRVTNPSAVHTLSFYAKTDNPNIRVSARIVTTRADGSAVTTINPGGNKTLSSDWQRFSVSSAVTGAGGTEGARIQLVLVAASGTQSGTIWIDGVQFEESASAGNYFDGTAPGCAWVEPITGIAGTAHASPSISRAAFWVEEATTNTVPDPSFEAASITTNWAIAGAATISKVTTSAYIGSNAAKVSCGATNADGMTQLTTSGAAAASGQTWTVSAYVRAFASGDVGKQVRLRISGRGAAGSFVEEVYSSGFTLTDAWQRITFTTTLANASTTAVIGSVYNSGLVAVDFLVDAVQLEQKGYATSYCDGSLGTGYTWAGTAHASSSSRAATTLRASETNHANATRGAIAAQFSRYVDIGNTQRIIDIGHTVTGIDRLFLDVNISDLLQLSTNSNGSASLTLQRPGALSSSTPYLTSCSWDGTSVGVAINSEAPTTGTRAAPVGTFESAIRDIGIGGPNDVAVAILNGVVGPVAIFDRPLTQAELALLQTTDPRYWWNLLGP